MYERLKMIRDMVKEGMVIADIGTDHALLPVMLIKDGKASHVYACDIAAGPLQRAEETVHEFHMEEKITLVQSDGFANVPSDTDGAVIAGMGYDTAVRIMNDASDRLAGFHQILLELHCDPVLTRRYISSKKWTIDNECFLIEKGHAYTGMSVLPDKPMYFSEEDIVIGPVLKQKADPAYIRWLQERTGKIRSVLTLSQGRGSSADRLMQELFVIEEYLRKTKKTAS